MSLLFSPLRVGALELPSRVVMAPMTRARAGRDGVPTPLMARYYAQRATAGLIVAEATQIGTEGQGYLRTPGVHSDPQVAGCRQVTSAVHDAGGRIVLQLWHVGRVSHPDNRAPGSRSVAPSPIPPRIRIHTAMVAGGYGADSAERTLREGLADLIGFGRPYIANPDLALRLREGMGLGAADRATSYSEGERGYTDYLAVADLSQTAR